MITFHGVPVLSPEQRQANADYANSLGLGGIPSGSGRLAIVGSAPSVEAYRETLKRWNGGVWAINGAFGWCKANGIKAKFFSVHPTVSILPHIEDLEEGDEAYLADQSDKRLLHSALGRGAKVSVYSERDYQATASAPHAAFQGIRAGYTHATFFGCDLSYAEDKVHITRQMASKPSIVVKSDGDEYLTTPAYFGQAQEIRNLVKAFPEVFRERSSGLLRAMCNAKYEVTWVSGEAKTTPYQGQDLWQSADKPLCNSPIIAA